MQVKIFIAAQKCWAIFYKIIFAEGRKARRVALSSLFGMNFVHINRGTLANGEMAYRFLKTISKLNNQLRSFTIHFILIAAPTIQNLKPMIDD